MARCDRVVAAVAEDLTVSIPEQQKLNGQTLRHVKLVMSGFGST